MGVHAEHSGVSTPATTSTAATAGNRSTDPSSAENEAFVDSVLELTAKLVGPLEISEVLHELAEKLTELLGLTGAGVALVLGSRLRAATAVPRGLLPLEAYQEEHQEGPCVAAYRSGELQIVCDLRAEHSWPGFREVAAQVGMRAMVGVPMTLAGTTIGAINLYDDQVRRWSREHLRWAEVMANIATGYLLSSAALARQTELAEQLQNALDSRVLIEQAKGVLAEANGVSVDEAYTRLRQHARSHRTALRSVARQVVAGEIQL